MFRTKIEESWGNDYYISDTMRHIRADREDISSSKCQKEKGTLRGFLVF
jgi:hypothetical protein